MDAFAEVGRLACLQHALVVRSQVLGMGVSTSTLDRWLSAGRLLAAYPSVYRMTGAPVTWEQRLLAAVLAAGDGALASHRSSARLWGVHDDDILEVSVPVSRRARLPDVLVHRSVDIGAARPVRHNGVRTTNPLRMLVDLGAVVDGPAVEDFLDRALQRRLVTVAGVEAALDEVSRQGRSGAGVLRKVLDERALGTDRPDSLLEPRMARLLRAHNLPPADFQHVVRHDGRFVARIDFAYPGPRLAIEVDGWESHSSPRALQSDLDRQNALIALGWAVIRFTWHDVVRRPAKVAAGVQGMIAALSGAA